MSLALALRRLLERKKIKRDPFKAVAAVSVGVVRGVPLLDLDYEEDGGPTSISTSS